MDFKRKEKRGEKGETLLLGGAAFFSTPLNGASFLSLVRVVLVVFFVFVFFRDGH